MKFIKVFLVILLFVAGHLYAQQTVQIEKSDEVVQIDGQPFFIHEVKQGQTLYSIARAYETVLEEILKYNPVAARSLEVGEKLKIPVQTTTTTDLEKDFDFFYHVSKNGETFQEIAGIYTVDPYLIKNANPDLKDPLREGQYVKIPVVDKSEEQRKPSTANKSKTYFDHVVKKGETLYGISRQYKVEMEDIIRLNPNLGNSLEVGRVLRIPSKTTYPAISEPVKMEQTEGIIRHKVKSGENIYRIAIHYGISVDTIRQMNPGLDESRLRIGQVLQVPIDKATGNFLIHKVEERQSNLDEVAQKYSMDIESLKAANPGIEDAVYRGQIIKIPLERKNMPQNALEESMMQENQTFAVTDLDSVLCIGAGYNQENKTYKIALFVPLYLENIDSLLNQQLHTDNQELQRAMRFVQFYEGFMIAVDSLQKQGMSMEIYVYDVNTDIEKTVKILEQPEMRSMDLIVGPFFSQSFFYVSSFAQAYGINIINPFTSRHEVVSGRKEVFKAQPSKELLPQQIKTYIKYHYPGAKIILIKENPYQYQPEFAALKKVFNDSKQQAFPVPNYLLYNALIDYSRNTLEGYEDEEDMLESLPVENKLILKENLVNSPEDTTMIPNYVSEVIYMNDSLQGLKRELSVVRKNVLITISEDKAFILDLLANLNVMKDSAETHVIGLPDWNQFIDFEPELFMNMDVQIIASQLMNYNTDFTRKFIDIYKRKYYAEPGVIAGQGFDIGYYFLSALYHYGKDFEDCLQYHHPELTQNHFVFRRDNPDEGYENIYWYFYNFRNYKVNQESNPFVNKLLYQKQSELSHAKQFFD